MAYKKLLAWTIGVVALGGCAAGVGAPEDETSTQALAGSEAAGVIPEGMPSRVAIGLFENTRETWMSSSGVNWDARYRYFTKGWVNNWGWGSYDGSWGLNYIEECAGQGYLPAVQYYQIFGEPGGGEGATLSKVQNADTMRSYFGDFKILMERVKEHGGPVMVLLEADAFGFLQQQSNQNPNTYAAIADSGMAELSGLPNTVAGWGLAFLQIKKAVGADNAILGAHLSAWGSGQDVTHFSTSVDLEPEVDKVYSFLAPAGLADNVTGLRYDVMVADPLDRDADYYRLERGQDRWWDPSDTAPINSKSFNRYREWLRLFNQKAATRIVLWQIPEGNSNNKNVYNNGGASEGYKDNRSEYFLGDPSHIEFFADAGVISLLFGVGTGGMAHHTNDYYPDGQLYIRSRARAILNNGGVAIERGDGTSSGGDTSGGGSCDAAGSGSGLTGSYYSGMSFGQLVTTRTDAAVDFNWGSNPPLSGMSKDKFSVRWEGQVMPQVTGSHTFYTTSDDGVRLWIDGQLIIDNWANHAATEDSGAIRLTAGTAADVVLDYYENGGKAVIALAWESACNAKQTVPASQLFPVDAALPEPTCSDGVQNGEETGVDCGGSCTACATCSDGVQNGEETGVDCGGSCSACTSSDPSDYHFEGTTHSWTTSGGMLRSVSSSSDRAAVGAASLKVSVDGGSDKQRALVSYPNVPAGATISFRVWIPAGTTLSAVQPYVLEGPAGGWRWTGNWQSVNWLDAGSWNTIYVNVPSDASDLFELGVEFATSGSFAGSVYVDAVDW